MSEFSESDCINIWLGKIRDQFVRHEPDLLDLFDVYANEARFGREYLSPELARLSPGAKILEVGAGSCLLSCQLVREGYSVTALEPLSNGFSHFHRMQERILAYAGALGCAPDVLCCSAEGFVYDQTFDFSFSVNVMEHVNDPKMVMLSVIRHLAPGARYRFTCPNYIFPYEPHFNIPTFFLRGLPSVC